jgi:hypothetical protein
MSQKKPDAPTPNPVTPASPPNPTGAPRKKKLSLDITDVSEVLERKISP